MEDILKKVIVASNIEEEDKELFTTEFYKSIGQSVKKQMKLNKKVKKLDGMFRENMKEQEDKYNAALAKYNTDHKALQDEIKKCMDILKDEAKVKNKVKSLGLKYSATKSKIPSLVNDDEFAEQWISMKETNSKLKKIMKELMKTNTRIGVGASFNEQISLQSKSFNDEVRVEPIENITHWHICYDGITYSDYTEINYESLKQLEEFGWSVKTLSRKDEYVDKCGCWGTCDCTEKVSYRTVYTVILKPDE